MFHSNYLNTIKWKMDTYFFNLFVSVSAFNFSIITIIGWHHLNQNICQIIWKNCPTGNWISSALEKVCLQTLECTRWTFQTDSRHCQKRHLLIVTVRFRQLPLQIWNSRGRNLRLKNKGRSRPLRNDLPDSKDQVKVTCRVFTKVYFSGSWTSN